LHHAVTGDKLGSPHTAKSLHLGIPCVTVSKLSQGAVEAKLAPANLLLIDRNLRIGTSVIQHTSRSIDLVHPEFRPIPGSRTSRQLHGGVSRTRSRL